MAELTAAKAENARNKCRDLARQAVTALPDKYDRERITKFVETFVADKLKLDAAGTGLAAVGEELFPDYLVKLADSLGVVKASTGGRAGVGTATIGAGGGEGYAAAKQAGNLVGMIAAAPEVKNA